MATKTMMINNTIEQFFSTVFPKEDGSSQNLKRKQMISKREQTNSCDCGVFCCMYAFALAFGIDCKEISQKHMEFYRQKMIVEILNKTILR